MMVDDCDGLDGQYQETKGIGFRKKEPTEPEEEVAMESAAAAKSIPFLLQPDRKPLPFQVVPKILQLGFELYTDANAETIDQIRPENRYTVESFKMRIIADYLRRLHRDVQLPLLILFDPINKKYFVSSSTFVFTYRVFYFENNYFCILI
ncbi:hypothetical protein Cni_G18265 [Canna indica]|uniref:Uncharacterized protein n=1 Tax=Canna indica TaxID=4628 RepID=A0AAQ3KP27_9LILI|nr:hypothetical protein Cni_G18265 [Canna indica]